MMANLGKVTENKRTSDLFQLLFTRTKKLFGIPVLKTTETNQTENLLQKELSSE